MDNAKVKDALGIGYSGARNRLMNHLVFGMLSELDRANCYRCDQALTEEDFTIEHKLPWLYDPNAVELFYDLDNIAFSHLACNAGAKRTMSVVEHGGGVSGKKNCTCKLCRDKKAQYQLDWKAAHRVQSNSEGELARS